MDNQNGDDDTPSVGFNVVVGREQMLKNRQLMYGSVEKAETWRYVALLVCEVVLQPNPYHIIDEAFGLYVLYAIFRGFSFPNQTPLCLLNLGNSQKRDRVKFLRNNPFREHSFFELCYGGIPSSFIFTTSITY